MTGRWVYCPAVYGKISRRVTVAERFRRWLNRKPQPDVFMTVGYFPPYYKTKGPR